MPTLYATSDRKRFFHVPDDAKLPPGDRVVRSLTGKKLSVDPVALDVYEVPEDEAMRIAQGLLSGFADSVRSVALSAAAALQAPPRGQPDSARAREERIAEHLKLGREQLRNDPAALGAALKGALGELVKLAQETVHTPEAATERMKDVAEAVRQEGGAAGVTETLEGLPDRLRELLASEAVLGKLDAAATGLRAAAEEIRAETARKRGD